MAIRDLVQKSWWRNAMAKLYAWGASVVMIGALMKLEHFPMSSYFLIAGLGTGAIIFFFSAFEPLPQDWDWDRVYPELAKNGNGKGTTPAKPREVHTTSSAALNRFDEMLEKAEITPELFSKLGNGMRNLAESTSKMTDISQAHLATSQYSDAVKKAAANFDSFSNAYSRSTEELNSSAANLTHSYTRTAEQVTQSASRLVEQVNKGSEQLTSSYTKLLETVNQDYTKLAEKSKSYTDQLEKLNRNLASLNTVYELQLKSEESHSLKTKEVASGIEKMVDNLNASVENTKLYKEEVERLGKKLTALNKVYGNMLTAMNVREND